MKILELLYENISLSSEVGTVRKLILNAVREALLKINRDAKSNHEDLTPIDPYRLPDRVNFFLTKTTDLESRIQSKLWGSYKQIGLHSIKFVNFTDNANGKAQGRTILLNAYLLQNLIDSIVIDIKRNVNDIDITNFDEVFSIIPNYTPSRKTWDILKTIANTCIHELVHVVQDYKQSHRTKQGHYPEYRSYLTKHKKEFAKAVEAVLSDVTEQDSMIYRASPQEIAAFAHNMAIDLIDIATDDTPIDEMRSKNEVNGAIINLDDIIKYSGNYSASPKFKQYLIFNNKKNPQHYKIYKRFMKRVYQEIMQYKTKLQQRLVQVD
ncbi:MAG: hypothetical protein ACXW2E_00570 [Nitrososphaeraceae archaeon]